MTRSQFVNHLVLLAGALFLLAPVALIMMSSGHSTTTLRAEGLQLSWGGRFFENFASVFRFEAGFTSGVTWAAMLKNSTIVAIGSATVTTVLSLLTAYAIVFFRMRGASFIFWLVFITLLFPIESRIIPTFVTTTELGLINTHLGIILPTLSLALGTFFFRQYFLTIPGEYLEAATLDGAGPVRFLIDFIVPLSFARAGAIFTISFMIGWNQYLWPLMISTDDSLYTLVRGIRLMGPTSGPGMALLVITIVPPFIMLIVFQRWFFSGLLEPRNFDE